MSAFNFKRQAKLYIVHNDKQYNIDIEDVSFSQTFTEDSYSVKTLHTQSMFEASSINKANPANFEFTMPTLKEADSSVQVVLDRLIDYDTVDLYISTQQAVFKLEYAVFANGSFVIEKSKVLSISVSGEASKLSKVGTFPLDPPIPGTVQSRAATRTFLQTLEQQVTLGGVDISTSVYNLSVELQNEVAWNPYTTIHAGILATDSSNSMYPTSFTVGKRILAGSIGRYLTDSNSGELQDWDRNVSLRIKVGQNIDGTLYGFDFNMPTCSFTNRLGVDEVFTQNYDWRLTDNSTALSSIINKLT
jgi:hypothetical protein